MAICHALRGAHERACSIRRFYAMAILILNAILVVLRILALLVLILPSPKTIERMVSRHLSIMYLVSWDRNSYPGRSSARDTRQSTPQTVCELLGCGAWPLACCLRLFTMHTPEALYDHIADKRPRHNCCTDFLCDPCAA